MSREDAHDDALPWHYFMTLGVLPADQQRTVVVDDCAIVPRRWHVGPWDWALLATEHEMHVPWQIADAQARACNVELAVRAADMRGARERLRWVYVGLLLSGLPPFAVPFVSTHSVNDFSALKGAAADPEDARHLVARPIVRRDETVRLEWNSSLGGTARLPDSGTPVISAEVLASASEAGRVWSRLSDEQAVLLAFRDTYIAAPQIADVGQSLLHLWTGLEGLFPNVQTEVSVRLALYLAQLAARDGDRLGMYNRVREGYKVRSKVAHGGKLSRSHADRTWAQHWSLFTDVALAVLDRGRLPDEQALTVELLSDQSR